MRTLFRWEVLSERAPIRQVDQRQTPSRPGGYSSRAFIDSLGYARETRDDPPWGPATKSNQHESLESNTIANTPQIAEAFSPRTMAAADAGDKPTRLGATPARVRAQ